MNNGSWVITRREGSAVFLCSSYYNGKSMKPEQALQGKSGVGSARGLRVLKMGTPFMPYCYRE
jgi:hypothetical protein